MPYARSTASLCPPWWAPQRLLATSEEWADPRCQTILEHCAIALPCRGRHTPPAQGIIPPASHAATPLFHVLSRHSTNILSIAANCFRPHTMESLSSSQRTLVRYHPTPASDSRCLESEAPRVREPKLAQFDNVQELATCVRRAQLTATRYHATGGGVRPNLWAGYYPR